MSYDLSGSIVSETYQRLLQISPGDNQSILDGSGSQPPILHFKTASAEMFSGSFYGNGSNIVSITASSITNFNLEVSRSAQLNGFGNFSLSDLNSSGIVSSSPQIYNLGYQVSQSSQILIGRNLFSSSNQFLPITTSSITNFNLEVSRSAQSNGFGNFSLVGTNVVSQSEQLGLSSTDNVTFADITGSNLSIGNIQADSLNVTSLTYTTISLDFSTGSNAFGYTIDDIHIFTGSLFFNGGLYGSGSGLTNLSSSQIDNFSTDVSKSAAASGFGNFSLEDTNTISSSQQITDLDFYKSETQYIASGSISSGSICYVYQSGSVKVSTNLTEVASSKKLVLATTDVAHNTLGTFSELGNSGNIYNGLTPSTVMYLSETGRPTSTQPSTGNTFLRIVGYSETTSSIYFNPSTEWYQLSSGSQLDLLDSKWQMITSSNESVGSLELGTYNHIKTLMDGNFDLTYVNTSSLVESVRHMFVFKTDGSNRTINNSHANVFDNFTGSFILSGSERGVFELFKDGDGEIIFTGGTTE